MTVSTPDDAAGAPPPPAIPNFREDERVVTRYSAMLERRVKAFVAEHDASVRRNTSAKRDQLRSQVDEAQAEWAKRHQASEAAREAYRKAYPENVTKTHLAEPSMVENMRSMGAAKKLYQAAEEAWLATEHAMGNVRRIELNEEQLELELQREIEHGAQIAKELTESQTWLDEVLVDDEMRSAKAQADAVLAERAAFARRLAAGTVPDAELRLRAFAEAGITHIPLPVAAMMFLRIETFGAQAYYIVRDLSKQLYALPYDTRLEPLLTGIYDIVRKGKEFEVRKSMKADGRTPLSLLDHFMRCSDSQEDAQTAYRLHQDFAREKRALATAGERDAIELIVTELLAKAAAEKA